MKNGKPRLPVFHCAIAKQLSWWHKIDTLWNLSATGIIMQRYPLHPDHASAERIQPGIALLIPLLLAVVWIVSAWLLADQYARWRSSDLLATHENQVNRTADTIALGLDRDLTLLHGLPAVIGQSRLLAATLKTYNAQSPLEGTESRRTAWSKDPHLIVLHERLAEARRSLAAFSVIWAIDLHGDCIAASNYDTAESFVGTNYKDRKYFREAMQGGNGRQYAIGRKTNIPGLYFSSPVRDENGRVIGAVAGKVDLAQLSYSLKQAQAILTDENGVVILANDKSMEMRAMPNSIVSSLSEEQRLSRYRRTQFSTIKLERWGDIRYPGLMLIDDNPSTPPGPPRIHSRQ